MSIITVTGIYLGNFSKLDTDESDFVNEFELPEGLVFDNETMLMVSINQDDANDDGLIMSDDNGRTAETMAYDIGTGPIVSTLDSEANYFVDLLLGDGTVQPSNITIFQLDNGDLFAIPFSNLDSLNIQSITIKSLDSDNFLGKDASASVDNTKIVCFASGTLIETDNGNVAVENLRRGDLIKTVDNGFQPIRWIGFNSLDAAALERSPKLYPIRFRESSLGDDLPSQDLYVSRQHRIFVRSRICERMFGVSEILLPAIQLTQLDGIEIVEDCTAITYWHFMLDRHELIWSNGAVSESLYYGCQTDSILAPAAREEIASLFPEIANRESPQQSARLLLSSSKRTRTFLERYIKNGCAGQIGSIA